MLNLSDPLLQEPARGPPDRPGPILLPLPAGLLTAGCSPRASGVGWGSASSSALTVWSPRILPVLHVDSDLWWVALVPCPTWPSQALPGRALGVREGPRVGAALLGRPFFPSCSKLGPPAPAPAPGVRPETGTRTRGAPGGVPVCPGGEARAAHRDAPGQKPSQKGTLTAAWVAQPRCRRTVMLARTWQESGQTKGGGGGSLRSPPAPRAAPPRNLPLRVGFWRRGWLREESVGGAGRGWGAGRRASTYPLPHRRSSSRFS